MKKLILMTALLVASSLAARAEFYLGASLTSTASDIDSAYENASDFDTDDMGWKAYVGWNFLSFLGAEAGYRDLGSFSGSTAQGGAIPESIGRPAAAGDVALDLKVVDISARAFLPIGKLFNIYGKVGYANIQWDGQIDLGEEIGNFNEDDWELFYGIGSEFNIGKNFAIRAEWEIYDASEDLNTLSAGLIFRF